MTDPIFLGVKVPGITGLASLGTTVAPADGDVATYDAMTGKWVAAAAGGGGSSDGWNATGATLAYSSADAPTFVASTSVDLTGVISVGMRLKLTQATVQYFIVTAIDAATITLYGGTDYTLANAAITLPFYSSAKAPQGFPLDPAQWTELVVAENALYASTSLGPLLRGDTTPITISVPIGAWRLSEQVTGGFTSTTNGGGVTGAGGDLGLSTAVDDYTSDELYVRAVQASNPLATATSAEIACSASASSQVTVAAKTLYHLLCSVANNGADQNIFTAVDWSGHNVFLRAECAYL